MKINGRGFSILGAAVAAISIAAGAFAQDAAKVAPNAFTQKVDNKNVQVFEYHSKPGEKEAMHSHRANLVYVVQGGKLRYTFPDGKTEDKEIKTGDVQWREATKHAVENIGTTEVKVILVEVKCAKGAPKAAK